MDRPERGGDGDSPLELSPETFAEVGHRLVDEIAGLLGSIRDRPLTTGETRAEIRTLLGAGASLPTSGAPVAEVMHEATELLLSHSLFNGHPRFFGYITAGPAPVGILADLLASAVNPNVGAWVLSPVASEIEGQVVRWLGELIGYPADGDGLLVSGGNMANMLGFWAARASRAGWDVRAAGMRGGEGRDLVLYGATGTHTWIQKAADLSGLGTDAIRWIETDPHGRMRTDRLRTRIEEDLAADRRPFLVVGNAGTVGTGAVDPLPVLREICDTYDMWLHVDGAYGALAACAPDAPADLRALALADSVALDPHKWMYVPLEAGCTLVRDPEALVRAFSYRPAYYAFDEDLSNYHERGIQNSRGFRALKVWMALQHLGRDGYARLIGEDIALAERFFRMAQEEPELDALSHGLSITTFRYLPTDLAARMSEEPVASYLNDLTDAVQRRMERGGEAFVSRAFVGDILALRMCIVNFRTTDSDLVRLRDLTVRIGRAADLEMRPISSLND